jgi:outer membrane receptor protein involved in Fe transport
MIRFEPRKTVMAFALLSVSAARLEAQEPKPTNALPTAATSSGALAEPVQAQPAEAAGKPMPEVVVTATRTAEEVKDLPQSVTVVAAPEIARHQAETPNEMLREQPGIWSVQTAAQGSPIIRGQMGNRVLYLWDGIPINNGALFSGPNGYFNQVPIGSVERMEVIRGPGSVQYGSGAIGGVINIITKQCDEFPDHAEFGGDISARYGTVDEEYTETADFWLASTNFNLFGGISSQNVGNYRGPDVGVIANTGFNALGGNVSMAYQPAADQTVRLNWIYNDRTDVDNYVQSKLNPDGIPRIFDPYEERMLTKLDYDLDNLGPLSSELKFYAYFQDYDQQRERRVEAVSSTTETLNNTKTTAKQDVFGGGVQNTTLWDTSWGEHKFTYGLDYRTEDLRSDQDLFTTITPPDSTTESVPAGKTPNGTYDVFDLFAMAELHPLERWTLSLGGRFERTHLHSTPSPLDVIPNAGYSLADLELDKTWNAATWSVGTVYNLTPDLDLAADIATGYRAPDFSDTLSTGAPIYSSRTASLPSPGVEPEKSITYELGPRYHSERWDGSLTAYWTALSDVITSATNGTVVIPGQGTFIAQHNSNAGEGYVRGIELAAAYRPYPGWTLFGNGTYTQGWDTRFHENYRFIPPLNGVVGVRYEALSGRWWAEAAEVLVDALRNHAPADQQDAGFSTDPGFGSPSASNPPLNGNYEIKGYEVTNLRGGVRVWHDGHGRRLDLTLDINNLFNERYREAYAQQELVAPGLGAVIGARLKF